jgi:hypothetical protein
MGRIILIVFGSVVGLLVVSVIYSRRTTKQYLDVASSIKVSEIPNLMREAMIQFQSNNLAAIDLNDPLNSIDSLEKFVIGKSGKLKFPNYKGLTHMAWMISAGVILGELLRAYTQMVWIDEEDGPGLKIEKGDKSITAHPLEKIMKHERSGVAGELRLYAETILVHKNEIMK